jgi:hypothetical protein
MVMMETFIFVECVDECPGIQIYQDLIDGRWIHMNDENLSEAFRAGLKGGLKIVKGRWIFTPIAWFNRQAE